MRVGWATDNGVDRVAASDDFNEFATRVLAYCSGYLDELVGQFVGFPAPVVDFVGRFEHLVDDTCMALRLGGESFSEGAARAHPKANFNDYDSFPPLYRPDVAARLAEAEHQTIERFYPDDPIPEALIDGSCPEVSLPVDGGARAGPPPSHSELQRWGERIRAFERALDQSRRAEKTLELALSQTREELDLTERSLDTLRASRVMRYTRPLRLAYYHTRGHRDLRGDRARRSDPLQVDSALVGSSKDRSD